MMKPHARTRCLLGLAVLLLLNGCRQRQPAASKQEGAARPIEKHVERGPVRATVRVDKDRITIAEELNLVLDVTAEPGVEVRMPQFGEQLDEFQIRHFHDTPAVPVDDGRRWRQEYELDIFLSGEYAIPAMTVEFVDRRNALPGPATEAEAVAVATAPADDAPGVVRGAIETPTITITVTSLLEGDFDPAKFEDIKGPVPLPSDRPWGVYVGVAIAALVVVLAIVAWVVLRRRRRGEAPEPVIPADEWALEQLRQLRTDDLVGIGLVAEFYFRLTMIVRQYIERRFAIMAAEQTTDEFLAAAQRHPALNTGHRDALGAFLRSGDMVKFARYEPGPQEIEDAFTSAERFVHETALPREAGAGNGQSGCDGSAQALAARQEVQA